MEIAIPLASFDAPWPYHRLFHEQFFLCDLYQTVVFCIFHNSQDLIRFPDHFFERLQQLQSSPGPSKWINHQIIGI